MKKSHLFIALFTDLRGSLLTAYGEQLLKKLTCCLSLVVCIFFTSLFTGISFRCVLWARLAKPGSLTSKALSLITHQQSQCSLTVCPFIPPRYIPPAHRDCVSSFGQTVNRPLPFKGNDKKDESKCTETHLQDWHLLMESSKNVGAEVSRGGALRSVILGLSSAGPQNLLSAHSWKVIKHHCNIHCSHGRRAVTWYQTFLIFEGSHVESCSFDSLIVAEFQDSISDSTCQHWPDGSPHFSRLKQ